GDYNPIWLAITRTLLPRVLAGTTAIIADSHATRADLERFYGVSRGRVTVVYPGVDDRFRARLVDQRVQTVKRRLGVGHAPYILCLGPWGRRKNLEVVVEAFSLLTCEMAEVQLVITGRPATG